MLTAEKQKLNRSSDSESSFQSESLSDSSKSARPEPFALESDSESSVQAGIDSRPADNLKATIDNEDRNNGRESASTRTTDKKRAPSFKSTKSSIDA